MTTPKTRSGSLSVAGTWVERINNLNVAKSHIWKSRLGKHLGRTHKSVKCRRKRHLTFPVSFAPPRSHDSKTYGESWADRGGFVRTEGHSFKEYPLRTHQFLIMATSWGPCVDRSTIGPGVGANSPDRGECVGADGRRSVQSVRWMVRTVDRERARRS